MNIAVILAGGSGSRVGGDKPKQFLRVAGKMIIEHTIEAFHDNPRIDEIAIVSREDYIEEVRKMVADNGYAKVKHVLCGGKERYHSSLAAISTCSNDNDRLLLHDCVRPLVTQRIINDCLDSLDRYEAVDVAVPTTDTIIETAPDGRIVRIPSRNSLRNVQTPQASAAEQSAVHLSLPCRTRLSCRRTTAPWCSATCRTLPFSWSRATQ